MAYESKSVQRATCSRNEFCRLVSGSVATAQDSLGVTVKREPEAVRAVANNSLQICTGSVAAVADTANGWKTETPLSGDQANTDYGTSTIAAFKDIVRDT